MNCRLTRGIGVAVLSLIAVTKLAAQENPAKRLSSIVGVAVEEYAKAVDESGKLISKDEYDETFGFLTDAKQVAARLTGYEAPTTRAILDSLTDAVASRKPPSTVQDIHRLVAASLGPAGAMDLPKGPLSFDEGHRLFSTNCASCHGVEGQGDGPSAHTLSTAPPGIGSSRRSPHVSAPLYL